MLNINYDSRYKKHAGTSVDWCPSDTEIAYSMNIKNNYELLNVNGWINSKFKYTYNSHGFRCDEFTDEPTIMFLGGSITMGLGLPIEQAWSTMLAKHLNMKSANLAISGGSGDTAFRLCHGWIDKIKPKIVVFLEPIGFRMEIVNDSTVKYISINYVGQYDPFIRDWIIDENNMYLTSQKNQLAIKSMCDSRNIKYFYFNDNEFLQYFDRNSEYGLARDLTHPGLKPHQLFFEHVSSKIGAA